MNQENAMRAGRFAGCAALLALLIMSSSTAAKPVQVASVPVFAQTLSSPTLSSASMEETVKKLEAQREQALALLQSVLDDPRAQQEQITAALEKKTQIASNMEKEAAIGAQLAHMGFDQTAVVMGNGALSIIAPWQMAENEQNRIRMIDAAASLSGISAGNVKIILSKK